MTARSRIARLLTQHADMLLTTTSRWPDGDLYELPRAAVEECAAILQDAAAELESGQRSPA